MDILPVYPQYVPHIFTDAELRTLFAQIDACRYAPHYPFRQLRVPVLFRMLYCCGLRVSEAANLTVGDVELDNGVVKVQDSKYGSHRRVPMSSDLTERCKRYTEAVHSSSHNGQFFFCVSRDNRPVSATTVYLNFRQFLLDAGIPHGGKGKGPRLHDLRHTFAVHCLRRWVREGKDLSAYLPILKSYLGHSKFAQTAYYLRLTADYNELRKSDRMSSRFIEYPYPGKAKAVGYRYEEELRHGIQGEGSDRGSQGAGDAPGAFSPI